MTLTGSGLVRSSRWRREPVTTIALSFAEVDCALATPPFVGLVSSSPSFALGSTCAVAASEHACFAAASAMFAQLSGAGAAGGVWASAGLDQTAPSAITDAESEKREAVDRRRIVRVPSNGLGPALLVVRSEATEGLNHPRGFLTRVALMQHSASVGESTLRSPSYLGVQR